MKNIKCKLSWYDIRIILHGFVILIWLFMLNINLIIIKGISWQKIINKISPKF